MPRARTNGRNVLVADDLTLNASTVLHLRYSFTRHPRIREVLPHTPASTLRIQPWLSLVAGRARSLETASFRVLHDVGGGVGGTADYNIFGYASMNSDASATITKVRGKQELSFGFEWMKRYLNVGQPPAPAGS